ncbi:MAG: siderophore-interacting protein [Pseudomonadota bacterium]
MNAIISNIAKKLTKRSPRLLTVKRASRITPNMIRVTFSGPELVDFPTGREGGNCKIMLPQEGQDRASFAQQLNDGPKPVTRTYTVRHFRADRLELDVDFVAHGNDGHAGPACEWAENASEGSFCGFAGPSQPKMTEFYADWYLLAADMSALPVVSAALEAMPDDAKGVAVFEVLSDEDVQDLKKPEGIEINWIVSPDPHTPSTKQVDFIQNLDWPDGVVQTCIAGESSVIRSLRDFLHNQKQLPKKYCYISGYWKIGLVEDQHQAEKRAAAT